MDKEYLKKLISGEIEATKVKVENILKSLYI